MPKKHIYQTIDDTDRADGGAVFWSRLERRKLSNEKRLTWAVPVKCSNPQHSERWVRACDALSVDFNTRDRACMRENPPWKLTGELMLPKGSNVFFDKREPGNVHGICFQCRCCSKPKYTDYSNLRRYLKGRMLSVLALIGVATAEDSTTWCRVWPYLLKLNFWDELCSECVEERGNPYKLASDKESLKSATVTLFSLESDLGVPVFAAECQHIWLTTRINAVNNWHIYIEICPNCQHNSRAFRDRLKELGRIEANDPRPQDILEDVNAVITEWKVVRNPKRSLDEQYRLVTQARVAAQLDLSGKGFTTGDRKLSARLSRRKVPEMFPAAEKWFRAFVDTIIEAFETAMSPEKISSGLIFRLHLARSWKEFSKNPAEKHPTLRRVG